MTRPTTTGSPAAAAQAGSRGYRIGVDIGGTFTDLTLADEHGVVAIGKVLTTPDEPARAIGEVIGEVLARTSVPAADVEGVVHGTTLVTNAIIERKGAVTALLTTAGFRDVVEMGTERRYELYDLMIELPKPLVPRHLRLEVRERMLADGTVERALDEDEVAAIARELEARGVEALGIAFLHSYANPQHERAAAAVVAQAAPKLRVGLSSDVAPEIREYERASTTLANVYVQDRVARYLSDLEERIDGLGVTGSLFVMLSNGGIATVETAKRRPIGLLESGPAAGALAAAAIGGDQGHADLLSFDMGGTTAKLCMIEDGRPLISTGFEVDRVYRLKAGSGLPIKTPVVDMIEIGVGGGSIARIDALGLLKVGPDSAGSQPGPVCYGQGGVEPTVTDADLVLGYLNPGYFLGGAMMLDVEAAREAIRERIAEPLGVSVEQAAWGIHRAVNEDMANAARVHAVERGREPSLLPLYAFGGAGPVHAAGVARAADVRHVVAPTGAGVLSSAGFLTAPLTFDFVRSHAAKVADLDRATVDGIFAELEARGGELLVGSGVAPEDVVHERSAEMRYLGQGFEIRVPVPDADDDWPSSLLRAFEDAYLRLYGRQGPPVPVEVLNWRLVSSGPRPGLSLRLKPDAGVADRGAKGERPAYFGEWVDTPVYARYGLRPGDTAEGPAIVEERESTLIVPPDAAFTVADNLSLVVDLKPSLA
ncbi:MAG: hydantoinase/oxoprolinase family protein [Actinobacteria bacterium]|nr:hydantoinase/oxoprolinase family protein [Actinomycetota bacterium]